MTHFSDMLAGYARFRANEWVSERERWEKLGEGGVYNQCGWLDDKFGISWQIVPSILGKLMSDPSKATRVVQAFMKMTKFDIEKLVNA